MLDLINKAIQYSKEARQQEESLPNVINEPLFPEARRSMFYLRLRENMIRGCRKAVKIIPENWKRSVAYSMLIECLYDLFHYGYSENLVAYYNKRLDDMIGTH